MTTATPGNPSNGNGRKIEDVVAQVRARPEFTAESVWTLWMYRVGGRGKSGVLPEDALDYFEGCDLADEMNPMLRDPNLFEHQPLWVWLRVSAADFEVEWGVDRPIPVWMPMDADFDLNRPTMWLIQWLKFDRRPAGQLPQFWKDKLAALGAWDAERDDIAVDERGNPLHGPRVFDRRGRVL